MWFDRDLGLRLSALSAHFPVVLLTGARQTGKTSLLRKAFPERAFVTLDLPSVAEEAESHPRDFLARYPPPVTLDEVQYAPGLFRSLKVAVDARRDEKGLFLLTGSQRFHLMRSLSESLAGRCALLELHTLSAKEYARENPLEGARALEFLLRGGYPELCADRSIPIGDYYRSYVATYLERDVRNLVQVGSLRDFERFVRLAASRSASLLNRSEIAREVGVATSTVSSWLSVIEASGVVRLLEPYYRNFGKRVVKTPKLYFLDTGLLCFLLGLSSVEALVDSPFLGKVWETFVFGQIVRELETRSTAAGLWFWRDAHGLEVDFLLDAGDRVGLIECRWSEQPTADDAGSIAELGRLLSSKRRVDGWVACRTPHPVRIAEAAVAVNPLESIDWVPS